MLTFPYLRLCEYGNELSDRPAELNFSSEQRPSSGDMGELSRADLSLFDPIDFGMYCVVLMGLISGTDQKTGKRSVMLRHLFHPQTGQVVQTETELSVRPRGWMLAFCPELLEKTGLGRDFICSASFSPTLRRQYAWTRLKKVSS